MFVNENYTHIMIIEMGIESMYLIYRPYMHVTEKQC